MERAALASKPARLRCCGAGLRRRARWFAGLSLVILILLAHGWALRHVPGWLALDVSDGTADYLLVLDGDQRVDQAAADFKTGQIRGVLLMSERGQRAADLGIIASPAELTRLALVRAGIPAEDIELLPRQATTRWEQASVLREWLSQNPDARVRVLCQRLDSRHCQNVFARALGPAGAARIEYVGLPDRLIDESSWWTSRYAVKSVFKAMVQLAYDELFAEPNSRESTTWNPDDYERSLR
jgi:hypothetical protein